MRLKFHKPKKETPPSVAQPQPPHHISPSSRIKNNADKALSQHQYLEAIRLYSSALSLIENTKEQRQPSSRTKQMSKIYSQLSECYYMIDEFDSSNIAADKSLELDNNNVDARGRKTLLTFHKKRLEGGKKKRDKSGSRVQNWIKEISKKKINYKDDLYQKTIDCYAGEKKEEEEYGDDDIETGRKRNIVEGIGENVEDLEKSLDTSDDDDDDISFDFDELMSTIRNSDVSRSAEKKVSPMSSSKFKQLLPSFHKLRIVSPASSQKIKPPKSQIDEFNFRCSEWLVYYASMESPLPDSLLSDPRSSSIRKLHLKIRGRIHLDGISSGMPDLSSLVISEQSLPSPTTFYHLHDLQQLSSTLTHLELNLSDSWICKGEDVLSHVSTLKNLQNLRLQNLCDGRAKSLKHFATLINLEHLHYRGSNAVDEDRWHADEHFSTCRVLCPDTTLDLSRLTKLVSLTFVGCSFCAPFENRPELQALVVPVSLESLVCCHIQGSECTDIFREELTKEGVRFYEEEVPFVSGMSEGQEILNSYWKRVNELEGGVWMESKF